MGGRAARVLLSKKIEREVDIFNESFNSVHVPHSVE